MEIPIVIGIGGVLGGFVGLAYLVLQIAIIPAITAKRDATRKEMEEFNNN